MIHACELVASAPSCAVPVLPPVSSPSMNMPVAVPDSTTTRMASRRVIAAVIARHARCQSDGSASLQRLPSISRISFITWGFIITPSLATAAATNAICNGDAATSF